MLATPLGETLQHAELTEQPSTGLPGLEESAGEPLKVITLLTPQIEVVEAVTITLPTPLIEIVEAAKVVEVEEVAEARETEKDMALATLIWTQIHPSRAAVAMGLVPHSLDNGWYWCCSCGCCS